MSALPNHLKERAVAAAIEGEGSVLSLVTEAYEAGRRESVIDERLPERLDLLRVMAQITEGKRSVFQITIKSFARICAANGLFTHLPPYESTQMEHLWRDELKSAFCGPRWTLKGPAARTWRVRCPQDGNFWIEPCSARR